ncbi:lipoprotein [Alkalicoccobacillus porphyridii]|nr:lipoprotein [Alkalicoccobacillus porphyridii]
MKTLIGLLFVLFLTACGRSGELEDRYFSG